MPPVKGKAPVKAPKGGVGGFVGRLKSFDGRTWLIAGAAVAGGYILYKRHQGTATGACPDGSTPDSAGNCPQVSPVDNSSGSSYPNQLPPLNPGPGIPGGWPGPQKAPCPPGFTQGGAGKCCPPGWIGSQGGCIRKKKKKGHTLGPVDHTRSGWTTVPTAGPKQRMPFPRILGDPVPGYAG